MNTEARFKGTPVEFGVLIEHRRWDWQRILYPESPSNGPAFFVRTRLDGNPGVVEVRFGGPKANAAWEFGYITAVKSVGEFSTLFVSAQDRYWAELESLWDFLIGQLETLG